MNISNEKLNQIMEELNYSFCHYYEDDEVNNYFNYYTLLELNENYIIQNSDIDLDNLLYEEYFWYSKFKTAYKRKFENDEGIEQQQFKMLEVMDQRLSEGIDWDKIKAIEELMM